MDSTWTSAHDLGRQYLEQALAGRVTVRTYNMVQPGENAETVMEQAIAEGPKCSLPPPPSLPPAGKIAVQHPGVRILNCSVSMPYTGVRTYYSRIYEGKLHHRRHCRSHGQKMTRWGMWPATPFWRSRRDQRLCPGGRGWLIPG